MVRAVLDANVFVSALLRPEGPPGRVLEAYMQGGVFDLVLSPAIVAELKRALGYPKIAGRIGGEAAAEAVLVDLLLLADVVDDGAALGICRDPDDDKYLAAAAQGRAEFIVTGDDDLLALKEHGGAVIVTPREFLVALDLKRR